MLYIIGYKSIKFEIPRFYKFSLKKINKVQHSKYFSLSWCETPL